MALAVQSTNKQKGCLFAESSTAARCCVFVKHHNKDGITALRSQEAEGAQTIICLNTHTSSSHRFCELTLRRWYVCNIRWIFWLLT
jgi:hypothetical protein